LEGLLGYFITKIETIKEIIPLIKLCTYQSCLASSQSTYHAQRFMLPLTEPSTYNKGSSSGNNGLTNIDLNLLSDTIDTMEDLIGKINTELEIQRTRLIRQEAKISDDCERLESRIAQYIMTGNPEQRSLTEDTGFAPYQRHHWRRDIDMTGTFYESTGLERVPEA
ncbi:hypothetical protein GZH46_02068, partial [Fragariocoptes setiger]